MDKKTEQGGKSNKHPKPKEQPRDILYYAQRLSGPADSFLASSQQVKHSPEPADREDAGLLDDTVPLDSLPDLMPDLFDMPSEDSAQPTFSEILHAVYKCTASVDELKEKFGRLRETVSLLRQDLQKIMERTTAVE